MRTGERDVLLFILAIAAGSADGWSYAGLGHTFVANMTGNTVLLGMAVCEKNGDVADRLISMLCYLSGVALATWLNKNLTKDKIWTRSVSLVLLLEAALLIGAEAGWVAHQGGAPVILPVLLGMGAFAVGLQSGTMLQLSIPGIVTTYITGTWTTAISGLVKLGTSERSAPSGEKLQFEERTAMQLGILAVYLLAAILTGWFERRQPAAMGAIPAAAVLLVAVCGWVRCGRGAGPNRRRDGEAV